ncbi:MAG: class I SAM-dependent methyltransferase [Thermodesulfovibrio sp.]|nr:class I SAM-dependent methyltransferase [Thermodesulfovibrio sp.]
MMDQEINSSLLMNTKFWDNQWEKAMEVSTANIRDDNYEKWLNFWNFMSDIYEEIEKTSSELILKTINIFKSEELINRKHRILEIGCGIGNFTVPISYEVKHVTALDYSAGMTKKLKERTEAFRIGNIEIITEKWENFYSEDRYDFVLAAFCPAIKNAESLIRMKKYSKGYACLVTTSRYDNLFRLRDELWKRLTNSDFKSEGYHIIYPFAILYSLGHRPQLKKISAKGIIIRELDSLIMQYCQYFSIFLPIKEAQKSIITQFFEEKAHKGKVKIQNEAEIYIMWW